MNENSREDLNNLNQEQQLISASSGQRPIYDDNGKPAPRVQRTQLHTLQPAGGNKNQSSSQVDVPNDEA